MSLYFLDTLVSLSLSIEDPEAIENFLLDVSNQFKTVRLSSSELTTILDKITNNLIPELSEAVKSSGFDHEIIAKTLSFFNDYLTEFSQVTQEHQWKSKLLAFAVKCYKLSTSNKVKTVGLQVVQNLYLNYCDLEEDPINIAKALIRELTSTSKTNPVIRILKNSNHI